MLDAIMTQPIDYLADSRLINIAQYSNVSVPRILLRAPVPAEASEVVLGCDISLNSELYSIKELGVASEKLATCHGIVLMIDMGDLREGVYYKNTDEILRMAEYVANHRWLALKGVGVNLTCYGSVVPDKVIMERFASSADFLHKKLEMKFEIVSGGNSSAIDITERGDMPAIVNNLRIGEFLVRGEETAYQRTPDYMESDVVTLEARLIEIQEKPSYPEGNIGLNAFGEKTSFTDKGVRRRGILNIGRQDIDHEGLACHDKGVEILGASSDHLIVDLSEAENTYHVGDFLGFSLTYSALLRAFTSKYVDRSYHGDI